MTCTEEYKEHIEYTFQAFCKVVIRNAAITAARTRSRKYKREISLEYLTDEKHYPLGTAGKGKLTICNGFWRIYLKEAPGKRYDIR